MITIISGTNRPDSYTEAVANHYLTVLEQLGLECQLLNLKDLPHSFAFDDLYGKRTEAMQSIISQFIEPVHKFVFVMPEYNGSFPGVLKTFIDAVPPKLWKDKKAAIVGVSSGRAGNLRGQEHLTGILHYLKLHVHYNKPKISGVEHLMDINKKLTDESTLMILLEHAQLVKSY